MVLAEEHNIKKHFSNPTEFEKLFRGHYANLCAYANKFLKDLDAAEEVVQELFFNLWKNRDNLDIKSNLSSYLFRSVRNSCLNQIKHIKIKEDYKSYYQDNTLDGNQNASDSMIVTELEENIRNAIDRLPTERKKVFIMSRYDGLKYKEIAEKLNISIKTVENQMGKAIKFLKEELSEFMAIMPIFLVEYIINFFNK